MKVFAASMCAAVTIQLLETVLLIVYMIFAMGVNFGDQLGYIALTCVAGAFAGVTFGTCITSAIRGNEGLKVGITIAFSMLMSFLSGLQYAQMKTIIQNKVPILGYLNPLNVIADSFYALYYYTSHTRYFLNLGILCGFTVVFGLVTYLILRRQKYASL
jgi:ABC-2 type transport system permease protein